MAAITDDTRALIGDWCRTLTGRTLHVIHSGRFVVEDVARRAGVKTLHSADVTLAAAVLGEHLAGRRLEIRAVDGELNGWLADWLDDGPTTLATLILLGQMLAGEGKSTAAVWRRRQYAAFQDQWPVLHKRLADKIRKAADQLKTDSFETCGVQAWCGQVPDDDPACLVPPLADQAAKIVEPMFGWQGPPRPSADEWNAIGARLPERAGPWLWVADDEVESLGEYLAGVVQLSARDDPTFVYHSEAARPKLARPAPQKLEPLLAHRLADWPVPPLQLVKVRPAEFAMLRTEYLNPGLPGMNVKLGVVCVDGRDHLFGAFGVGQIDRLDWCDTYVATDFAIRPSGCPLLSKLVLACVLSAEAQTVFQQTWNRRVKTIGTTAFTKRAVSAKYRGLFDLRERKDDPPRLYYQAAAGRWDLTGAYDWWRQKAEAADARP